MNLRRRILGGATTLAAGQLVGQACRFVRNIIIARLISPEDFGIAATFVIAVSLLEMISDLAVDRLLVQAKDGDEPRFQHSAQLIMALRGMINAGLIMVLSWPVTAIFDIPEARWAFQWLALVPLIRGFGHLDVRRLHRKMRFGPNAMMDVLGQMIALAVAWPIGWWLGDYSAVLWLLVLQAAMELIISHAVARRPYAWAWDAGYVRRMAAFGWPLLLNGLILFAMFQGDQAVVGAAYSMADLAIYSVAFGLTMLPTLSLSRIASALFLPLLSSAQETPGLFADRYRVCLQSASVIGAAVASALIVAGPWCVRLLYGEQYAEAGRLIGWLAAMQAARLFRLAPTLAAMAKGDTRSLLLANIARSSSLAAAAMVAALGGDVVWIAITALGGELLAVGVAIALLARCHEIPVRLCVPGGCVLLVFIVSAVAAIVGLPETGWTAMAAIVGVFPASLAAMLLLIPECRPRVVRLIPRRRHVGSPTAYQSPQ